MFLYCYNSVHQVFADAPCTEADLHRVKAISCFTAGFYACFTLSISVCGAKEIKKNLAFMQLNVQSSVQSDPSWG